MIKRTPQEIADFFGCYVAQDDKGAWYAYANKPDMIPATDHVRGYWNSVDDSCSCLLYECLFVPENHDWTHLYKPSCSEKSADFDNKEASCSEKAPDSDNKPAHLGEVYTHKEFQLVYSDTPAGLSDAVTNLIGRGWSLYGSPFAKAYGAEFYLHQAMVRGV